MTVLTCFGGLSSTVEESEREVRVLVKARNEDRGDCADCHEIVLSEPLGDRQLIDESRNEPVPVNLNDRIPNVE